MYKVSFFLCELHRNRNQAVHSSMHFSVKMGDNERGRLCSTEIYTLTAMKKEKVQRAPYLFRLH